MILLIPPFRNTLKHATIEPLIIPKELLDELKTVLANPKKPDLHKFLMMHRISGTCSVCGKLPSHIAKYRVHGIEVIERYCDECLARISK